jgi:hypothetical protein
MEEGQARFPASETALTPGDSSFNSTPTKLSWRTSLSSGETTLRDLKSLQLLIKLHEGNEKAPKGANAPWDCFSRLFRRQKPASLENLRSAEYKRQPREPIVQGRKQLL